MLILNWIIKTIKVYFFKLKAVREVEEKRTLTETIKQSFSESKVTAEKLVEIIEEEKRITNKMLEDAQPALKQAEESLKVFNFLIFFIFVKILYRHFIDNKSDWYNNFRLYLTTKLPNPSFTPEVCAVSALIDFTVTTNGLGDQLLNKVITYEKSVIKTIWIRKNQFAYFD